MPIDEDARETVTPPAIAAGPGPPCAIRISLTPHAAGVRLRIRI